MPIEQIELELINDNPYQSRQTYHRDAINELAASIRTHGLLQVPLARRKDGNVELAVGHLRKRAFLKLAKEDPGAWHKMPLDIRGITDQGMAIFALEENLKRHDITPIEVARAVDSYLTNFTNETETSIATQLNMTQGNISNMRRVLRLPLQVLEKIDQGRINFTMGRELLVFQGLSDEKDLMLEAIRSLRTENRPYREPNTVEGIQKCIHNVARSHMRSLQKGQGWSYNDPLFDTKQAGCLKCPQMIRTHPTKSQVAHWCTNKECWDLKQQEHKDKLSAEARAKMTEDVLKKVAVTEVQRQENISQEIIEAEAPSKAVLTPDQVEEYGETISQEEEQRFLIEQAKRLPADWPCHGCLNIKRCDRTTVYAGEDGKLHCEQRVTKETAGELEQKATVELPEELRHLIEEKAGTRAQVLDLNEVYLSRWQTELKQGYVLLSNILDQIVDPDECLKRCTQGFHYAFDSQRESRQVLYVCTNPKCLARKKSAFTRAKHAGGQTKKRLETAAIRKAVQATTKIDRARMKLIILAQIEGYHTEKYYYRDGTESPEQWLWKKVSPQTQGIDRNRDKLFQAIDKLGDGEMAKLIVEFMLEALTYKGELENYQIKTTQPLDWMGIGVNAEKEA